MTFPESASCVAAQYAQPKEAGLGEVCADSEEVVWYLAGKERQKNAVNGGAEGNWGDPREGAWP